MVNMEQRWWCAFFIVSMLLLFGLELFIPGCTDYFALVPANTLITHTYTWNLLTAAFFETNPLKIIINSVIVWNLENYINKPNMEQFGLFVVFSSLACTIGASILSFFRFIILGIESPLVVPQYGFNGILVSLMMFVRHELKNQPISARFPLVTFQNLPVIFIATQTLLRLIGIRSMTEDYIFAWIGLFFSWSYLKFYYKFDEVMEEGYHDFTFVEMFPETFHVVLNPFTTSFQILMSLIGVFPRMEHAERKPQHHLRSSNIDTSQSFNIKQDVITERRRAKAMKILDAKLAELSKEPEGWDENDNEELLA